MNKHKYGFTRRTTFSSQNGEPGIIFLLKVMVRSVWQRVNWLNLSSNCNDPTEKMERHSRILIAKQFVENLMCRTNMSKPYILSNRYFTLFSQCQNPIQHSCTKIKIKDTT